MGSSRRRFGVQVGGQGCGQDRGSRSGVKVVVKVGGQGQGHDRWSQGRGSRSGSRLWGQGQGHDLLSQGRGSRLLVKVRV